MPDDDLLDEFSKAAARWQEDFDLEEARQENPLPELPAKHPNHQEFTGFDNKSIDPKVAHKVESAFAEQLERFTEVIRQQQGDAAAQRFSEVFPATLETAKRMFSELHHLEARVNVTELLGECSDTALSPNARFTIGEIAKNPAMFPNIISGGHYKFYDRVIATHDGSPPSSELARDYWNEKPRKYTSDISFQEIFPDSPTEKTPHVSNTHHTRAGGNVGGGLVDSVRMVQAIRNGDSANALSSGTSAAVNFTAAADDIAASGGYSSGLISKATGPIGMASTIANTGVEIMRLEGEDLINKREKQGEALTNTAVGIGGGLTGAAVGASTATALGLTGYAVGVASTGGALLVATAVTAAVAAGNHYANKALFGAEEARFQTNLDEKTHMTGLAGKFLDKLADSETGTVNWRDKETLNKYEVLLQKEHYKQEQLVKDNSSMAPKWMRAMANTDALQRQQDALSELNIVKSAQEELRVFRKEQDFIARVDSLDQNGDKRITREDLDRDKNGILDARDKQKIIEILGNDENAKKAVENFKQHGVTFQGEASRDVKAQTTPGQQQSQGVGREGR